MSVMETALLNTVLGIGTVFIELIFMSLIIGSLKHFNRLGGKKEEEPKKEEAAPPVASSAPKAAVSVADKTDDSALITAIASAAIAAYQSEAGGIPVPADGLVVRSIRRRYR